MFIAHFNRAISTNLSKLNDYNNPPEVTYTIYRADTLRNELWLVVLTTIHAYYIELTNNVLFKQTPSPKKKVLETFLSIR